QQIQDLIAADDSKINVIRDADGKILKLWTVWAAVEHFDDSGSEDRHYQINRSSGRFRFGDGKQGKMLPNRGADKVRVNYKVIAGARGNVEAREITTLRKSIAFVNSVSNPEPSGGGCDIEPLEDALRRGPQMIRHRNKAITASDFEWLARQAHQDIAKVKCLPGLNVNMERESGSILLAVLPKGGRNAMHFFPALKADVEAYLLEKAPSTIAFDGNIQVIEPAYLEVSILAHLIVRDMDLVVPTELEAVDKLNQFLNPLTGNYDGQGWNIGQQLHPSVFYALLKSIKSVNYIQKLSMSVTKMEDGVRREIPVEQMGSIPHGIVVNGKHTVVVDT
ncbi:MAG: putative baseplate assembly protein, partial [Tumebacillaceae bacterium]